MNRRERIVVVGGGLTGLRAAERLRELRYEGEIMIVGAERVPPYHRPALSKQLLMGTLQPSDLTLPAYEDIGAKWRLATEVRYLLPRNRTLQLPGGEEITYDGLIIATGVEARRPNDVPYHDPRVLVLRTLRDALDVERMISSTRGPVAVVGGGFTGCELAASLRHMGREVTLIGRSPNLLGNVLGPALGDWLTGVHRDHGVDLALNTSVRQWSPTSEGIELRLADGSSMLAACVVVAAGTVPTTAWLRGSGLPLDNGVVCEPTCHVVGAEDVVAAGDVAQWPNLRFDDVPRRVEHWLNAIEMGRAAAESLLAGRAAAEPFTPMPRFWTEQYGVRIQAAGMLKLGTDVISLGTADEGTGTVFGYSRGGRLMGVVGLDCPSSVLAWTETVNQQNPAPRPRQPITTGAPSRPAAGSSRRRTGKHSLPAREKEKRGRPEERRKQTFGWVDGDIEPESSGPIPPVGVGRGPGARPADAGKPMNAVDSFSRMLPVAVRKPAGANGRPVRANGSGAGGHAAPAARPVGTNGSGPTHNGTGRPWPAPLSGRLSPADFNSRIPPENPPPDVTEQLPPLDANGRVRWVGPENPHDRTMPARTNGRPVRRNGQPRQVEASGRLRPEASHDRLPPASPRRPAGSDDLLPPTTRRGPVDSHDRLPPVSRGGPADSFDRLPPVSRRGPADSHDRLPPASRHRPADSDDRLPPVSRQTPADSYDRLPPPSRRGSGDSHDRVNRPGPADSYDRLPPAPRPGPADSYDRLPPASRPSPAESHDRIPPVRRRRAATRVSRRPARPR